MFMNPLLGLCHVETALRWTPLVCPYHILRTECAIRGMDLTRRRDVVIWPDQALPGRTSRSLLH